MDQSTQKWYRCPKCGVSGPAQEFFIIVPTRNWNKVKCAQCWHEAICEILNKEVPDAEEQKILRVVK